jgi:choline dehydrogenase-like flavoprotein
VIQQGRELGGELRFGAEVCVIGSGAGGAVVAALLAEAGRDVVLLEQGGYHTAADFDQREERMLPLLFEDAAMRATDDGTITILQGHGVGGSTVHNLCYCFRAPGPILELWEQEHGVRELAGLEASFARVEAGLHVRPILEEELNPLNRRIRAGSELLGYHGLVAQHNRVGCVRSGFCLLGCSYDAKQSMLVTYVPRANGAGARVVSDARVLGIAGSAGARRVRAELRGADGGARGELVVEAPVVVCSAGAIATPGLLAASGLGAGSPQLGANLHLHPSAMAIGLYPEPLHAYQGIPQAYYIDEFIDLERDPHSGVILMPIAGFPALTAANLPGFGRDHFTWLRHYPRMGGLLALLHDRSSGTVSGAPGRPPHIAYQLTESDRRALTSGLKHAVEILWASGALEVIVPYFDGPLVIRPEDGVTQIDRRGVAPGLLPIASTHPQSTCRMGGDPARSVVGSFGELHSDPGVFVADTSVFPTSLGAPPQITTAALADRTAHHILERWPELAR